MTLCLSPAHLDIWSMYYLSTIPFSDFRKVLNAYKSQNIVNLVNFAKIKFAYNKGPEGTETWLLCSIFAEVVVSNEDIYF